MSDNKQKNSFLGFAGSIGGAIKKTAGDVGSATASAASTLAQNIKEGNEQRMIERNKRRYESDFKRLRPLFKDDLLAPDFIRPAVLRIVDQDERRTNPACEGAIGFLTGNEATILNIYKEHLGLLNAEFYPQQEDTIYHVDPCYPDLFIKPDEYFAYLKKVRVNELTTIAQDLGAKHVEILLQCNQADASTRTSKLGAKIVGIGSASATSSTTQNSSASVEVAACADFHGSDTPIEPKVVYFQHEHDILSLIQMRMHPVNGNEILSKTYSLQYGNSSGLHVAEAQAIDAVLKATKCSLSHSVTDEAMNDCNTILKYSISF